MASTVEIANRALSKLGDDRIIDFGDNTPAARAVSSAYDIVRDAVLREHIWGFALKRASLAALSGVDSLKYGKVYQLPSDFLRLVEIHDVSRRDYEIIGRRIEIDANPPLKITYVHRAADSTLYDSLFVEAFATRLAAEMARELTNQAGLQQLLEEIYRDLMSRAMMTDAKERPPQRLPDGSWLDSRRLG